MKLPANCFLLKLLSGHGLCIPNKRKKSLEIRTNELKKVIRHSFKHDNKHSNAENSDPAPWGRSELGLLRPIPNSCFTSIEDKEGSRSLHAWGAPEQFELVTEKASKSILSTHLYPQQLNKPLSPHLQCLTSTPRNYCHHHNKVKCQ